MNVAATGKTGIRKLIGDTPLGFWAFGMMFWWAWFLSFFFPLPALITTTVVFDTCIYRIILMGAYVATSASVILLRNHILPVRRHFTLLVVLCACVSASTLAIVLAIDGILAIWTVYMCVGVSGIAHGFLFLFWMECYGDTTVGRSGICISGAVVGGGLLYLLVLFLISWVPPVAAALLMLFPWCCLLSGRWFSREAASLANGDMGSDGVADGKPGKATRRFSDVASSARVTPVFIIYACLYGLLYGLMLSMAVTNVDLADGGLLLDICSMSALVIAGIFLLVSTMRSVPNYQFALRPVLVLVAAGFIVLAVTGAKHSFVATFLVVLGYIIFWNLFNIVWIEMGQRAHVSVVGVSAWGLGCSALAILLGIVLHSFWLSKLISGASYPMYVSLVVVFALLLMNMFLMGADTFSTLGGMVTPYPPKETGDELKAKVDAVAGEYRFTPRETEIAMMLARGRNPEYIQKELVVSVNTVRTHVRSIYAKCDVHSHQEFIDLVEQVETDDTTSRQG